jgi:hypothetical protein
MSKPPLYDYTSAFGSNKRAEQKKYKKSFFALSGFSIGYIGMETKKYVLKLSASDVNTVRSALGEMKMKDVLMTSLEIERQVLEQDGKKTVMAEVTEDA